MIEDQEVIEDQEAAGGISHYCESLRWHSQYFRKLFFFFKTWYIVGILGSLLKPSTNYTVKLINSFSVVYFLPVVSGSGSGRTTPSWSGRPWRSGGRWSAHRPGLCAEQGPRNYIKITFLVDS